MLDCERTRDLLGAFHDGELTSDRHEEVASHLEDCGDCAAARAELGAVDVALEAVDLPAAAAAPPDLAERVAVAAIPPPRPVASPLGRGLRVAVLGLGIGGAFLLGLDRWMEVQVPLPGPPSEEQVLTDELRGLVFRTERALKEGRVREARTLLTRSQAVLADLEERFPGDGRLRNAGKDLEFMVGWQTKEVDKTQALDSESALRVHRGLLEHVRQQLDEASGLQRVADLESLVEEAGKSARVLENLGRGDEVAAMLQDALATLEEYTPDDRTRRVSGSRRRTGFRTLPEYFSSPLQPYWDLAAMAEDLRRPGVQQEVLARGLGHARRHEARADLAYAHAELRGLALKERRGADALAHAREAFATMLTLLPEVQATYSDQPELIGSMRLQLNYEFDGLFELLVPEGSTGPLDPAIRRQAEEALARLVAAQRVGPYGESTWIESPRDPAIDRLWTDAATLAARLEPGERPEAGTYALLQGLREEVAGDTEHGFEGPLEACALRAVSVRYLCAGDDCSGVPAPLATRVRDHVRTGLAAARELEPRLPSRAGDYQAGRWRDIHDNAVRVLEGAARSLGARGH